MDTTVEELQDRAAIWNGFSLLERDGILLQGMEA